jgi:hypothetical protein
MNLKIIHNHDTYLYNDINQRVKLNDCYCICSILKNKDTRCTCKEFKEMKLIGACNCGRFLKYKILQFKTTNYYKENLNYEL